MEGFHCYNPSTDCDEGGLTMPIHEYGHNSSGGYSITGGFVYHGNDASNYQVNTFMQITWAGIYGL